VRELLPVYQERLLISLYPQDSVVAVAADSKGVVMGSILGTINQTIAIQFRAGERDGLRLEREITAGMVQQQHSDLVRGSLQAQREIGSLPIGGTTGARIVPIQSQCDDQDEGCCQRQCHQAQHTAPKPAR